MQNEPTLLPPEVREAREQARIVIKHHFGTKPARINYLPSGLSNFVFSVKHNEGDFVVRISPDPARINAFIKEQWAQGEAQKVSVPTAEILEVGNAVIPRPFMISRTVSGIEGTFHPQRMEILREMGRIAALINSVKTEGFGATFDWSNNQLSRNKTWKDFLEKELQIDARLQILTRHKMLEDKQAKRIKQIFEQSAKESAPPHLNHGDIRLKNVIVDDAGEINALIDWEHCTSNLAPQWELSLALHDLSVDEKQAFLEGYGLKEKTLVEMMRLVKAINMVNYAPEIQRLAEIKDTACLEHYRTRLGGALDMYSFT